MSNRPPVSLTPGSKSGPSFASLYGETLLKILVPILVVCTLLVIWQVGVWVSGVPQYILPGPIAIARALIKDWGTLSPALWVTTKITLM
ncbi:MAG: ABC transporter permease, partial [Hyphomicrobiales bacterium]